MAYENAAREESSSLVVTIADEEYKPVLPEVAAELCAYRKAAVEGRAASGIEDVWTYCEDAYNGEDEATRGRAKIYKPSGPDSGFIQPVPKETWNRSVAFLNITRPYVDSAAARIGDMLFPSDERNFEAVPTPKQDIESILTYHAGELSDQDMQAVLEMIAESTEKTIDSVAEAQRQIDDWLSECYWDAVGREVIDDAAKLGTGVVKGPVPMMNNGRIQPGSKRIDVRNCFPDPNCGDDIKNGDWFFERESISARKLRQKWKLAGAGWLPEQIKKCLEEGPKSYNGLSRLVNGKPSTQYELWYFQGEVLVEALLECGCSVPSDAAERVWANVTLCNDYIVRISFAPLQDSFTYHMMRWQKRDKHWAGIGIAEQLETPQRGLNAGIRNLFDNAALSALPMIVFWKGILEPVNGRYELAPGKAFYVADETIPINNVKDAISTIEIPTRQQELLNIVNLMRELAQETTGLPLITQGMGSTGAVGSDQLQTNAATTVLRRLAKEFDDHITVPKISLYYRWIKEMTQMDVPEAVIKARGSAVLVERDIQAQALIQMVQLAANPVYGLDPKLAAMEWVKSQKMDPRKITLTQEREQELNQMLSQPDEKAQATVESAKMRAQALTEQAKTEAETDRAELVLKQQDAEQARLHDEKMLDLKMRYELISYALKKNIDVEAAAAELEKAMKLKIVKSEGSK